MTVPIVPKYSRYSQWGCNFWDTINPTGPQCLQVLHMQLGRNTIQLLGPVFILPWIPRVTRLDQSIWEERTHQTWTTLIFFWKYLYFKTEGRYQSTPNGVFGSSVMCLVHRWYIYIYHLHENIYLKILCPKWNFRRHPFCNLIYGCFPLSQTVFGTQGPHATFQAPMLRRWPAGTLLWQVGYL